MKELRGKLAFVTGGVSGIGLGIAKALLKEGMTVVVSYMRDAHRESALKELQSIPDANVHAFKLDVTDRAAMRTVADTIERTLGPVDLLCNNAGVNIFGPMDDATFDDWDWVLDVNLGGTINAVVTFAPRMRGRRRGHIVNVGSMASFISGPHAGVYTTAKAAVRGLTECLRYSLARHHVSVSLLCPGLTNSNIHEAEGNRPSKYADSGYEATPEIARQVKDVLSLGMSPEEVGQKTVAAIKNGEFYIFTHPEFREDMEELCSAIMDALPEGAAEPKREDFERSRRERYRKALSLTK
jgi:NAD(P)-dependent dehydrogenase (short-subunit alcohol dehydrogenase family)